LTDPVSEVQASIGLAAQIAASSDGAPSCPFSAEEIDFAKRFIKRGLQLEGAISLARWSAPVAKWVVIILSTFWMFGDKAGQLLAYVRYWLGMMK